MGDPRNPARIDEEWNPKRLAAMEPEARLLGKIGALSGGWAWHFMSPVHVEKKIHHDHKDIDVLIKPQAFPDVINLLRARGYKKVWTQYDKVSTNFHRYEMDKKWEGERVKVQIDLFLEDVPLLKIVTAAVGDDVQIVEPTTLLSFYKKKIHQTDDCTAVQAARDLLALGISPVGRNELVGERDVGSPLHLRGQS